MFKNKNSRQRNTFLGRKTNFGIDLNLGRKHKPDYWIPIICFLLVMIGIIVVYSITPALKLTTGLSPGYYISRQILATILSIIAFLFTALIPLYFWVDKRNWIVIVAIATTFLAIILPVNPAYPAHRWVRFGGISFQSIEIFKFAVVIWLAYFFAKAIKDRTITDFKKTFKPLIILLVLTGVVVAIIQSDLGSMGVLFAMLVIMGFVAGLPLKKIMVIFGFLIIGLIISIVIFPYRIARIETYLHPQSNCQSAAGYQACQALIAVGSGGLSGLGLGHSVQAYGYEPEASNDSIFAIYAESFGFLGSIILVGLFFILFYKFIKIADSLNNDFARLLVIGILAWLSVQTVINIGAMVGLLPLKGITLPFVSYGGTSVIFSAAAVGLVFQISGYTSSKKSINPKRGINEGMFNRRRVGGSHNSDINNSLNIEKN